MKKLIPQSLKNIYHLFQAVLANVWFGFPSRKLKVIGVTGTNGKTTTVQMIAKILEDSGKKIAVASTINFKIGNREWVNDTKLTTLSIFGLQKHLREAVKAGCEYAVIEITSHALDQNRVWGTDFQVAVITNITREHLDYHKTIDEYARAKGKLFGKLARPHRYASERLLAKRCGRGREGKSVAVVNLGMKFAEEFLKYPAGEVFGYAVKTQNSKPQLKTQNHNSKLKTVFAEDMKLEINHSQFSILNSQFQINLPGGFNIENALAATCVGLSQGISLEKISEALAKIKGIPGRMERIENNRRLEIIVDYAVTPDALEKLYGLVSQFAKRSNRAATEESGRTAKIIAVFGSCGERDRGKRPIMGEIVAKIADYVIVTNEDPYGEDPVQIINEVFEGVVGKNFDKYWPVDQTKVRLFPFGEQVAEIPQGQTLASSSRPNLKIEGMNAFRILDRREAIKKALAIAGPGDIVVVTGKGAEETMAVGKERIPWNDPKVIREVLREQGLEKNQ